MDKLNISLFLKVGGFVLPFLVLGGVGLILTLLLLIHDSPAGAYNNLLNI